MSNLKSKIAIRPYQHETIENISRLLNESTPQKILLNLPTGAGKTFVATYSLISQQIRRGKNILWMANKWLHVKQFLKTLSENLEINDLNRIEIRLVGQNDTFENFKSSGLILPFSHHRSISNEKIKIFVSTIQTLGRFDRQNDLNNILRDIDTVVIDEAHWGIHGTLRARIEDSVTQFGVTCMALTATPKRGYSYEIVGGKDISYLELAKKGYLAKCHVHSIPTGRTYDEITETGISGLERYSKKIKEIGNDISRNMLIADTYFSKSYFWGKTIIFCGSIYQANSIANLLKCPSVHSGNYTGTNLSEIVGKFRTDPTCNVMTTVNMLNDGVDIPELKTIFLAFPTSSDVRFVQINGRATRDIDGSKQFYNLVDFYDTFLKPGIAKIFDENALYYDGTMESEDDCDSLCRENLKLIDAVKTLVRQASFDVVESKLSSVKSSDEKPDLEMEIKTKIKENVRLFSKMYLEDLSIYSYKTLEALGSRISDGGFELNDLKTTYSIRPSHEFAVFFDVYFRQDVEQVFLPSVYLQFLQIESLERYFISDFHFNAIGIQYINNRLWEYKSQSIEIFKYHLISKRRSDWYLHYKASKTSQMELLSKVMGDLYLDDELIDSLFSSIKMPVKKTA